MQHICLGMEKVLEIKLPKLNSKGYYNSRIRNHRFNFWVVEEIELISLGNFNKDSYSDILKQLPIR